jgi:SAM-dependent methyltransferase
MRSGAASQADTIPAVPRVEPIEGPEAGLAQAETLRRMAAARNYNEWLFDRIRPYLGLRVLDVGAGLGTFCELIAPWCDLVVALESDPIFAAALRDRFTDSHRVRVVEAEAEVVDPSSLPGPFDSIVCLNVLEHIRDHTTALRRFHDLLAPGGRLLLLVPAHQFLYGRADRELGHERRYSKRLLQRVLEQSGFAVEVARHVNPVGAAGWLVSGRLLRRTDIPSGPLRAYDRAVPLLRALDRVELPFGLSLWVVGRRPAD